MRITRYLAAAVVLLTLALLAVVLVPLFMPPWVELVSGSVLRTNASPRTIADVQAAVIEKHRNVVTQADGTRGDPTSSESESGWSSGPSPKIKTAEVRRGQSQITDKDGNRLRIERITSSGHPTLLFIEFAGPGGPDSIASEIATEFAKAGVRVK